MVLLFALGCGTPYSVYGGGGIDITFTPTDGVGFSGVVSAPGSADASELAQAADERSGFVAELSEYENDPTIRQILAQGLEDQPGLTLSESGAGYGVALYGDWLVGSDLQTAGAGGSVDYASLRIANADGSEDLEFWGTWDLASAQVTVGALDGSISGPMELVGEPLSGGAEGSVAFTQSVTVEWSFDSAIVETRHAAGQGSDLPSPVPTF